MILRFGKHKGKSIQEIDTGYLVFLLKILKYTSDIQAVEKELNSRSAEIEKMFEYDGRTMPFGKFKGYKIEELESTYAYSLLQNFPLQNPKLIEDLQKVAQKHTDWILDVKGVLKRWSKDI